jgi:hypothetical protein
MRRWRELAKFAAGVTVWEAVVHGSLLLTGQSVELFGITLTPTVNLVQTVVPGLLAAGLVYWAWIAPRRETA